MRIRALVFALGSVLCAAMSCQAQAQSFSDTISALPAIGTTNQLALFTYTNVFTPQRPGDTVIPASFNEGLFFVFGDGSSSFVFATPTGPTQKTAFATHAFASAGTFVISIFHDPFVYLDNGRVFFDTNPIRLNYTVNSAAVMPPNGAPAPLAGAGLLSFLGAGGLAMRKRASRWLGLSPL